MIDRIDTLLRDVLLADVADLLDESQIRFQPPDEAWRSYVGTLTVGGSPANAVNAYLVEVRENRKLRSNERQRVFANGMATDQPAPARLDCHYLLSTWSPATVSPAVEPSLDEHRLLYTITAALMLRSPLNPTLFYPPASPTLATFPDAIRDADLPTRVGPSDGFPKLPEFWGAMGANPRWRPAVWVVVTIPVVLTAEVSGPMVTTLTTSYDPGGDSWRQVGGHVVDNATAPPAPIPGAFVAVETPAGAPVAAATTDASGRFVLSVPEPGPYRLRVHVDGRPDPAPRAIDVPSATGEYDLALP